MPKQIQLKNGSERVYPNPFFPVGSIYMSINSTNPSTYFGGVWERWGHGRAVVGLNEGDGDFNTPEKTGGSKTHTLSLGELPTTTYVDSQVSTLVSTSSSGNWWLNNRGGGNQPHNNLQPYISCYMWKRTA